jgi:hypothetical protein
MIWHKCDYFFSCLPGTGLREFSESSEGRFAGLLETTPP